MLVGVIHPAHAEIVDAVAVPLAVPAAIRPIAGLVAGRSVRSGSRRGTVERPFIQEQRERVRVVRRQPRTRRLRLGLVVAGAATVGRQELILLRGEDLAEIPAVVPRAWREVRGGWRRRVRRLLLQVGEQETVHGAVGGGWRRGTERSWPLLLLLVLVLAEDVLLGGLCLLLLLLDDSPGLDVAAELGG